MKENKREGEGGGTLLTRIATDKARNGELNSFFSKYGGQLNLAELKERMRLEDGTAEKSAFKSFDPLSINP